MRRWARTWHGAGAVLRPADPVGRALTWSTMAASASSGLFYAVGALFFTRVVGLPPATVGIGLTVAGAAGVVGAVGAGYLADRVGAHRLMPAALVGQGVALAAFALAGGAVGFVVAGCAVLGLRSVHLTARAAVVARAFHGERRVAARAGLNVVNNLFVGAGTALAAVALLADTAAAYTACLVGAGLLVALSSLPLLAVGRLLTATKAEEEPGGQPPGRSPLRDRTYLGVTALNAVLAMHLGLQTVGVPLWIATHTDAPPVTVSAVMVLNTVLIALFQVRASRGTHEVAAAARAVAAGGVLLALSCALYAGSSAGGPVLAVLLLVSAAAVHTAGEIQADAGSWGLAFELAGAGSTGAYQGVNQAGLGIGGMLAPLVVTATAIEHGTAGWAVLAAVFAVAGLLVVPLVRRRPGHRDRPVPVEHTP